MFEENLFVEKLYVLVLIFLCENDEYFLFKYKIFIFWVRDVFFLIILGILNFLVLREIGI